MKFYTMNYGVWIDSKSARIVRWDGRQASLKTLYSGIARKPKWEGETSRKVKQGEGFDYKSKQQRHFQTELSKFIKVVVEEIRTGNILYITGPSQTKYFLENMILNNSRLMPRIQRVDSCSHITDLQLISRVTKFFSSENVK